MTAFRILMSSSQIAIPMMTRKYLPSLSFSNNLMDRKWQYSKIPLLTLNPLLRGEGLLGIHPKFCSSSVRESRSYMKQMKSKAVEYIYLKGRNFNLSHARVLATGWLKIILSDIAGLKSCPLPPLVIGLGVITPFVAVPVHFLMSFAYAPGIAHGHLAYGAIFLSFLGGIRWGSALDEPKLKILIKSIMPPLIAWSSLLLPYWLGCFTVGAGLISSMVSDRLHQKYQPWFRSYCVAITSIAILSITGSLFFSLMLPLSKN